MVRVEISGNRINRRDCRTASTTTSGCVFDGSTAAILYTGAGLLCDFTIFFTDDGPQTRGRVLIAVQ